MDDPRELTEGQSTEAALEALRRVTELERDLAALGANGETPSEVPAVQGDTTRGWVVVGVDRTLGGRPAVRSAFGPFSAAEDARRFGNDLEENGTSVFVVGVSDPADIPKRA